jgi:hypothetical protein
LFRHIVSITLLWLLAGCTSTHFDIGKTETVLPLNRAWVDGRQVEYITTDISDAEMANAAGVNYAPRLRDAIAVSPSVLERVYKFSQGEQISVFQSAPRPVGPSNTDKSYSPLWRLVMVKHIAPGATSEIKSEEELLSAEEKGLVSIHVTDIVVNCPVTRAVGGGGLQGVR